jgi:hypothetical protein
MVVYKEPINKTNVSKAERIRQDRLKGIVARGFKSVKQGYDISTYEKINDPIYRPERYLAEPGAYYEHCLCNLCSKFSIDCCRIPSLKNKEHCLHWYRRKRALKQKGAFKN